VSVRVFIQGTGPGTWQPPGHLVDVCWATMDCPGCGKGVSVGRRHHRVADDGTVTPSMVCPHAPCTFHEWIRLDGWEPLPPHEA
jgi:hypothetical protein